jgi:hypothetical protein
MAPSSQIRVVHQIMAIQRTVGYHCCCSNIRPEVEFGLAAHGSMSKAEKLAIELDACSAAGRQFGCTPIRTTVAFPNSGASHEFDIYAQGVLIGGVSTSPLKIGAGNTNTAACDRAASELLWLSLWPGPENRIHVLTDEALAGWLAKRYRGIRFPHRISIYHYDREEHMLSEVGVLHGP